MRIVEKCWINLHKGYRTISSLDARLKADWMRAIQVAQRREHLAVKTKWIQRRNIAGIAFLTLLFICALSLFGFYFLPESRPQLSLYFCVLTFLGMILGAIYLFYFRGGVKAQTINYPALALVESWWKLLRPKRYIVRNYGGPAEVDFLKSLSFLDNDYIAVWGLLTSAKTTSDTDVLLLGPNGIWIFEVKYWNGRLSKRNGVWYADSRRGGRKVYEKAPDDQWLDQKNEILKTFKLRLASKPWLAELIRGGVVFAHKDVVFGQINKHVAPYGRPEAWRKRIKESKTAIEFPLEDQLRVLDALITYANRYEKEKLQIISADDAAHQLYEESVLALRKYISERVK